MKYGEAYTIFYNIDSASFTDQEKLHAIKKIIGLATHNGVKKEYIINAFRWMYKYCLEEAKKPVTNADKIRSMTDEELAEFLRITAVENGCNLFTCDEWENTEVCKKAPCNKCAVYLEWLKMAANMEV